MKIDTKNARVAVEIEYRTVNWLGMSKIRIVRIPIPRAAVNKTLESTAVLNTLVMDAVNRLPNRAFVSTWRLVVSGALAFDDA